MTFNITKDQLARVNRTKLETLREKVDLAEAGLRNARDLLESEAKAQSLPTRGIFGSTYFVRRTTAESWLDDAQVEADKREARAAREFRGALKRFTAAGVNSSTVAAATGKTPPFATDEDVRQAEYANAAARIVRAGEERRRPLSDPVVLPPNTGDAYQDQVRATAAAIIQAGQNRRNGK